MKALVRRFRRARRLVLAAVAATLLLPSAALAAGPGVTLPGALHAFFADMKLQTALVVVFADFVLGVLAAVKHRTFRLSYVADFARNDLLFKLVPWLGIYIGAIYAGHQQLVIPGLDIGTAATAVYVAIIAAWTGSIVNSLTELGLPVPQGAPPLSARQAVAGDENAGPPKS